MPSVRARYSKACTASSSVTGNILRAADVVQVRVLRADAGVVQTGGDGVHRRDLAVLVLAEVGLHAVENAQPDRWRWWPRSRSVSTPRPAASQPMSRTARIVDEVVKAADGVGAAAHAGDDRIGQASLLFQHLLP